MIPDTINGALEMGGGVFLLNNCRVLWRDRGVKGVSLITTGFFTVWGTWNLWFYPSLGQWTSFYCGLFAVSANTLWVAMAIYLARKART